MRTAGSSRPETMSSTIGPYSGADMPWLPRISQLAVDDAAHVHGGTRVRPGQEADLDVPATGSQAADPIGEQRGAPERVDAHVHTVAGDVADHTPYVDGRRVERDLGAHLARSRTCVG